MTMHQHKRQLNHRRADGHVVHADDVRKRAKVVTGELARTRVDRHAILPAHRLRPLVWLLADMVARCPCRVNPVKVRGQAARLDDVREHGLCQGRAADVACTAERDLSVCDMR